LLDMGIEPFLIASTVRAIVGQRLVRRLVPESIEPYEPDLATLNRIQNAFGIKTADAMKRLHELELQAIKYRVGQLTSGSKIQMPEDPSTSDTTVKRLWRIKGESGATSFSGRMGIYEVLPMSADIQKLVIGGGSSDNIQDQAIREGMVTMQTDGLIKALRGQTALEEVMRVTSER